MRLKENWEALFPGQSSAFIKALRCDEGCFFDSYLLAIIQTDNEKHDYIPRPHPRKTYTVFGDRIEKLSEKKPQFLKESKKGFSPHNSTTMISPKLEPPVFASSDQSNAGIIFPRKDVLPNRYFVRDGWTTRRSYDFDSFEEASEFYNQYCVNDQYLVSSEKALEEAEKQYKKADYNEVLAYTRFSSDCYVAVLMDNQSSRWVAIHYAHELSARLACQLQQEPITKKHLASRVLYYLPHHFKHLQFLSIGEQEQEIKFAKEIAKNRLLLHEKIFNDNDPFKKENFDFLLVLDDEEGIAILKELFSSDISNDLINALANKKYFYHLDIISKRIQENWLMRVDDAHRIQYIKSCIERAKNGKILNVINNIPIAFSDHSALDLLFDSVRQNNNFSFELLLNKLQNINFLSRNSGRNLLHEVVMENNLHALDLISKRKDFDINAKTRLGHTALHVAVICNSPDMVRQLFSCSFLQSKVKDRENKTAKDLATETENWMMVDLISELTDKPQSTHLTCRR